MIRDQPEYRLQTAAVTWFRLQYPHLARLLFAVPNSNDLSQLNRRQAAATMSKLKKAGLTKGVSDLILAIPDPEDGILFIEMKIKPNKQSDDQKSFQKDVEGQGHRYVIVWDLDQFMDLIRGWIGR